MRKIIHTSYTNGVGNNIFQYMFGRVLAHVHGYDHSHDGLPVLGVPACRLVGPKDLPLVRGKADRFDFLKLLKKGIDAERGIVFHGYPEDYRIYVPFMDTIRQWFPPPEAEHPDDLCLHLRLGDRLLMRNCYPAIAPEEYLRGLSEFEFKRLHVVTDVKLWEPLTADSLNEMTFYKEVPGAKRIENVQQAVDYFNSIYDTLQRLNPVVRAGFDVVDDFDCMRRFGQLMINHGTLGWWAGALSDSKRVGTYYRWRPEKTNFNLACTDLPGWFPWGATSGRPPKKAQKPEPVRKNWLHEERRSEEPGCNTRHTSCPGVSVSFVCWKWKTIHAHKKYVRYTADHVNVLFSMLTRNMRDPFTLTCITDDPTGINSGIRTVPLWDDYGDVAGCFRRLKIFESPMKRSIGPRICSIDLDCVITGDVTDLFRRQEDFVVWGEHTRHAPYCGSMFMFDAGCRSELWDTFAPDVMPSRYRKLGSDQGWLNFKLYPREAMWTRDDGIYNFTRYFQTKNIFLKKSLTPQTLPRRPEPRPLPGGCRIVFFNGRFCPSMREVQNIFPWVREHWRV